LREQVNGGMRPWKVVSFHTDDVLYKWHIERLRASLIEFGIDSYIEEIPHRSSWLDHANYKPVFILKCLEMFDENIVWLDADAIVREYPVLFDDMEADIAVHYKGGSELLGGTVYVANNESGRNVAVEWVKEIERYGSHQNDQQTLQRLLSRSNYKVTTLPAPYTLIFDLMSHLGPPVIEHFQASRKGRR